MAKNLYKMDHAKRGIALVINIRTYNPNPDKLKERIWSEKDVENLKTTLEYLEFVLKFYENLTASEIEKKIQKIADEDHTNSDCFLCVIMSHGNDDKIIAGDSKEISFEKIMTPIKSCASLENKPKLFFFQACRGQNEMEQVKKQRSYSSGSTSGGNEADHIGESTSNKVNALKQNATQQTKSEPKQKTKMEREADLLMYYATLPEHYAFGNVAEGTIFIKSVCKELNQAYSNLPNNNLLSGMILNINKCVRESGLALADPINRLVLDVNFTPKKVSILI
jgi:hypothetical protein